MKPSNGQRILLVACALASGLSSASAQVLTSGLPEPPVVEPISPVTVVPGQTMRWLFPNLVDNLHVKHVYFEGSGASLDPSHSANLQIRFDWHLDPTDPPADPPQLSPVVTVSVSPSGNPIFAEFWIPLCPPWVSLDIQTDTEVTLQGVFVHQCIPEPRATALVAAIGVLGFGVAAHRRRLA